MRWRAASTSARSGTAVLISGLIRGSCPLRLPVQPAAVTAVAQPGHVVDLGVRPALVTVVLTHFPTPPHEPTQVLARRRASYSRHEKKILPSRRCRTSAVRCPADRD